MNRRNIPTILSIFLLILIEIILFLTNYTPGTYLAGWDNIMPELNLRTNLTRGIFGVWQEYRGLGLADGMSHAANTLHTVYIWLLSFFLPKELLRYAFIFAMHLLGGMGIYRLLTLLREPQQEKKEESKSPPGRWICIIGALFYMLNFATIQMFYTPFEAFAVHYATLPWLIWSLTRVLSRGSRRDFLIFFVIALASAPQYFVPTMILPTGMLIVVMCFFSGRENIKSAFLAIVGFLLIHAFWLVPYLYTLPKNAPVIMNAKINQMSSVEDFERNRAFGNITDVLLLRGFPLDFQDYANDGTPVYLMETWRGFLTKPTITVIGITFAIFVIIGLIKTITPSGRKYRVFAFLFLIGIIILGNNIPGIREGHDVLRTRLPIIGEALRFPFTKFSLLFALAYSMLVALGFTELITIIRNTTVQKGVCIVFIAAIILQAKPAFSGQVISPNMRVTIPSDYSELFRYMQKRPSKGRVMVLPQQSYWSWKLYNFGYRGSGFIWFGVPWALMDRAFDPWSSTNENAYWELSYALYKKDALMLFSVLTKYNIETVIVDDKQATFGNYRSLFINETKELLSNIPGIVFEKTFGSIHLYSVSSAKPMVSLQYNLPTIYPSYKWTDNDAAYREIGNYFAKPTTNTPSIPLRVNLQPFDSAQGKPTTFVYPFRSLFTKRSPDEREFSVTENNATITIASTAIATSTAIIKADAFAYDSRLTNDLNPEYYSRCGLSKKGITTANKLNENGSAFVRFQSFNQNGCLSFDISMLEHKYGYIAAVESRNMNGEPLEISFINDTAKHIEIESYLQPFDFAQGKPTTLQLRSVRAYNSQQIWHTNYFILPPLASDGLGYTVYLSNNSVGQKQSVNDIKSIRIYKIPYEEMVRASTFKGGTLQGSNNNTTIQQFNNSLTIEHPNPAYYKVQVTGDTKQEIDNTTLVLDQAYDEGWEAYTRNTTNPTNTTNNQISKWLFEALPFIFGTKIRDHVLVNNWENGWMLPKAAVHSSQSTTIVIFFWPQILEWIGFLLLPIPLLLAWKQHTP